MLTMSYEEIIKHFKLEPILKEGGMYAKVNLSDEEVDFEDKLDGRQGKMKLFGGIYYLLKNDTYSRMHKLKTDEIFHYYGGGSAEMLQLFPNGEGKIIKIGNDLQNGETPMVLVKRGVWQGTRVTSGELVLMGTTMSPAFQDGDYEDGDFEKLSSEFPKFKNELVLLCGKPRW